MVTSWVALGNIMLNERNCTLEVACYIIPPLKASKRDKSRVKKVILEVTRDKIDC